MTWAIVGQMSVALYAIIAGIAISVWIDSLYAKVREVRGSQQARARLTARNGELEAQVHELAVEVAMLRAAGPYRSSHPQGPAEEKKR